MAAFTCRETERLGRLIGAPLAVLAATFDLAAHALRLAETQHAAWSPREGWFAPFDDGLAVPTELAYAHRPFDARWLGRASLPGRVSLQGGCLAVDLPNGCAAGDFEPLFATSMAKRRFDAVVNSSSAVRWRFATGRPLHLPPRYALAGPREVGRMRLVEDLYAFRPRDLHAVAAATALAASGLHLSAALAGRMEDPR